MGLPGRRKKAASTQARRGEPGKRSSSRKKGQGHPPPPPPDPTPPKWLGAIAAAKWRDVLPLFERRRLVTELDRDALSIYCDAWQQLHDADATLRKQGAYYKTDKGYVGIHPAVSRRNKAIDVIRKVGEQLGLTPNSRRGLDLEQEACDPLKAFLQ